MKCFLGYYVGGNFVVTNEDKTNIKWFVKITNCGNPVYSHDKRLLGSLTMLRNSLKHGFQISTVCKRNGVTSASHLNNAHVSSNVMYGQNVEAISKVLSGEQIIFQPKASRVFTIYSSKNTIEISKWDLESHRSRSFSKENVTIDWFSDTKWTQVYAHSMGGSPLCGSLDELLSAIQNGRRIRFQLPDSSIYTTEADNLRIRNGQVTAQALKSVGPKGSNGFDKKGLWEWLMVSTTGIFFEFCLAEKTS